MKMQPTRYEAEIVIDSAPEYKSTGKVIVAMGIIGQTSEVPAVPEVPAVAATDTTPAVPAVPGTPAIPSRPIWGIDLAPVVAGGGVAGLFTIRKAVDQTAIKSALIDALRKIASELEQSD